MPSVASARGRKKSGAIIASLGGICGLALLTASAQAADTGAAPEWELEPNRCLFTQARCSGTLTIIYEHLQEAKQAPGPDNWRLEYWQRRLRDYYRYNSDRPE